MPRFPILLALLVAGNSVAACGRSHHEAAPAGPAPDSFHVAFTTSKGTIVVAAYRDWAPHGVDRFYQLVRDGFFDDDRFYRVLPGFIAQFGANDDPERNEAWEKEPIPADPPKEHNVRGTLAFAQNSPDKRTHQLFINLKDNPNLDRDEFVPIGRVVEGMSVADSLYDEYGNDPRYDMIARLGNKYLGRMFPKLDYIETARVVAP